MMSHGHRGGSVQGGAPPGMVLWLTHGFQGPTYRACWIFLETSCYLHITFPLLMLSVVRPQPRSFVSSNPFQPRPDCHQRSDSVFLLTWNPIQPIDERPLFGEEQRVVIGHLPRSHRQNLDRRTPSQSGPAPKSSPPTKAHSKLFCTSPSVTGLFFTHCCSYRKPQLPAPAARTPTATTNPAPSLLPTHHSPYPSPRLPFPLLSSSGRDRVSIAAYIHT